MITPKDIENKTMSPEKRKSAKNGAGVGRKATDFFVGKR